MKPSEGAEGNTQLAGAAMPVGIDQGSNDIAPCAVVSGVKIGARCSAVKERLNKLSCRTRVFHSIHLCDALRHHRWQRCKVQIGGLLACQPLMLWGYWH